MNTREIPSTITCTKDEIFRDMQTCLFRFIHSVKHPEAYSKDELQSIFIEATVLTHRADEVDSVRIPRRIYESIGDFILNCCQTLKQEHSDMLAGWECDRIDSLVKFFHEEQF